MYLVMKKKIDSLDAYNTLRKALSDSRRVITHTEFNASVEMALLNIQQQQVGVNVPDVSALHRVYVLIPAKIQNRLCCKIWDV